MTEEQQKRKVLYNALYTDLIDMVEDEKNIIRTETLKTLLGVEEKDLGELIARYKLEKNANEIVETDEKDYQDYQENQNSDTIEYNFDKVVEYWRAIHDLYVCYLNKLKKKHLEINKILIYEAPPLPYETEDKKSSIRKGKINYILAESCQKCAKACQNLIECKSTNDCKKCYQHKNLFVEKPSGAYCTTIKGLYDGTEERTVMQILVEQGILFIDLCPLPLPMTSNIRKETWGEIFDTSDDKPLSVVLLELALKFAKAKDVKISKTPSIAMGTPTATSQSIYLYFEKKKWSSSCFKNLNILKFDDRDIDFSELLKTNEKYVEKGQILPLYASNIIAGSNTPNADLLKRIF